MSEMFKVLIVDDEELIAETLCEIIEDFGNYSTIAICQPQNVLEFLKKEEIDLIFSDVRMPRLDGVALFKQLKENLETMPPFIFMSGFSDLDEKSAKELGARDILNKPLDYELLEVALKAASGA